MQTNFTPQQLKDPKIAEVESILRRCVHCGFCTATCPTYVLMGDERDSPRGRIYLMKEMFEKALPASPEVKTHVDRCLSCLSCMTTCPSGVDYMHLVDTARAHIEETGPRSLKERVVRALVAATVPYPACFRSALIAARLARPLIPLLRALGLKEMVAMLELAPANVARTARFSGPGQAVPSQERRKRVILLAGCAQQVLRPDINDATIRLLARRGVDVEVAPGAGCCGALVHHMGREEAAIEMAKRNVDAWTRVIEKRGPIDAVIINTSGCGTTVKDYGHMLRGVDGYADKAARIASITRDVSEFLAAYEMGPPKRFSSLRVAYHSACSMQHGQRIHDAPRKLLRNAGFTVTEIPEAHLCCGSAGTYNIMQPDIAAALRDRKVANIESVRPDLVAAGNIGCITQLATELRIPIAHTVELLDWAYGGPVPRGLEDLEAHVKDVPDPKPLLVTT
ncbi:MAG: glycolate oxidase iron-sulfur subunit [Hyphomicrobiales bacterium]|nr:MAG: glycolate oxidase iron-sulfur subunit [Hyphomicrobiales bacterium]